MPHIQQNRSLPTSDLFQKPATSDLFQKPATSDLFQKPATFEQRFRQRLNELYEQRGGGALDKQIGSLQTQLFQSQASEAKPGLSPEQQRTLRTIPRQSLETQLSELRELQKGRERRLGDITSSFRDIFEEEGKLKETTRLEERKEQENLPKRRIATVENFNRFRQELVEKGLTLDPISGQKFLDKILTSNNPETVINEYLTTASQVPAVKEAFTPVLIRRMQLRSPKIKGIKKIKPSIIPVKKETIKFEDL